MKLYILKLALLQPFGVPVLGYLIQTDGTNILVDSGFPYSYIKAPPGPQGPLQLQVEMHPEDHVLSHLASIGLSANDIHFLICTHFDSDHAGNHDLFTNAELVVQRKHYEIARAGHARSQEVRDHWDHPKLRYRLVDGDVVLLPGVELLETGGHVPGHQSVLVRLPNDGPILLAIDAIPAAFLLDPDSRQMLYDENEADTRASTRKLVEAVERDRVGLTIYGHDPEQWQTLKRAPEYYS
jgi:N-acyl homoserine lactone hydrolase